MTENAAEQNINPLGTDGFKFVEYTAADAKGIADLKDLFTRLGFTEVARHRSKQAWLYKHGDVQFIVNAQPQSQAEAFAREHGPNVCGMAFRVQDAAHAQAHAVANGARTFRSEVGPMELNIPGIYGFGESVLYFVDRYGRSSIYDVDFVFYDDWEAKMRSHAVGLHTLDHLTHNVHKGNMDMWSGFYERIVQALRELGMDFMATPDTYYDRVDERVPGHGEPPEALRQHGILIDGAPMKDGILLQLFTKTVIGPVFFEIIQRKGNQGFGEGNFKALFESIEEDQIRRGVLEDA